MQTRFLILAIFASCLTYEANAQNLPTPPPPPVNVGKGQAKIKIYKNIDGKITEVEETIDLPPNGAIDMDAVMKQYGFDDAEDSPQNGNSVEKRVMIITETPDNALPMPPNFPGHMPNEEIFMFNKPDGQFWKDGGKCAGDFNPGCNHNGNDEAQKEARLGVVLDENTNSDVKGVRISDVRRNTPADAAGLRAGDVLLKIAGDKVRTADEVKTIVKAHKPGDNVKVQFKRDGNKKTVDIVLKASGNEFTSNSCCDKKQTNINSFNAPEPVDPNSARMGISLNTAEAGPQITALNDKGGAKAAGLEVGDIITAIDGKPTKTYNDLLTIIATHKPGDVVKVSFTRNTESKTVDITLVSAAELAPKISIETPAAPENWQFYSPNDMPLNWENNGKKNNNKARLGVYIKNEVNIESDDQNNTKITASPIVVDRLVEEGAAQIAGLQVGDIIKSIDGQTLNNYDDLVANLATHKPGDEITISYQRNGQTLTAKAVLKGEIGWNMPEKFDFNFDNFNNMELDKWAEQWGKNFENMSPELKQEMENLKNELKNLDIDINIDGYDGNNELGNKTKRNTIIILRKDVRVADLTKEDEANMSEKGFTLPKTDLPEITNLLFSPNPSDGKFELSFEASERGKLDVRIYDLAGNTAYNEQINDFSGAYKHLVDVSNQPSGDRKSVV